MKKKVKTSVNSPKAVHTGTLKKPALGQLIKDFGPIINLVASIIQAISRLG